MDLVDDEEDVVTDIREQIFHNTVREHIVSVAINILSIYLHDRITIEANWGQPVGWVLFCVCVCLFFGTNIHVAIRLVTTTRMN